MDGDRALLTDEQVIAYIASAGSLSAALGSGDVALIAETGTGQRRARPSSAPRPKLADILRQDEA